MGNVTRAVARAGYSEVDVREGTTSQHNTRAKAHYRNPYPLPSVWGMTSPQGAEYHDTNRRSSHRRVFPLFHITSLFHRRPVRVDSLRFNAAIKPVDIRGGYPFLGGS